MEPSFVTVGSFLFLCCRTVLDLPAHLRLALTRALSHMNHENMGSLVHTGQWLEGVLPADPEQRTMLGKNLRIYLCAYLEQVNRNRVKSSMFYFKKINKICAHSMRIRRKCSPYAKGGLYTNN